jgi:hypothetical protein
LPFLRADFEGRCAYSMQHESRPGLTSMEVDHFNPTLPTHSRNKYANLFFSTRHCNNAKCGHWPTSAQIRKDIRFLNCCEEWDYGLHIFEDDQTHRLFGSTPAGRYHIRMCDLNAPHFLRERRERAALRELLTTRKAIIRDLAKVLQLLNLVRLLNGIVSRMIPPIPSSAG